MLWTHLGASKNVKKIRGAILGAPIIRIIVYWGLYCGSPSYGDYHLEFGLRGGASEKEARRPAAVCRVSINRATPIYYNLGTAPTQQQSTLGVLLSAIYNHIILIIQLLLRGGSTQIISLIIGTSRRYP